MPWGLREVELRLLMKNLALKVVASAELAGTTALNAEVRKMYSPSADTAVIKHCSDVTFRAEQKVLGTRKRSSRGTSPS
jgi:hypothetical protein